MTLAHSGSTAAGIEIEFLLLGLGFLAAAYLFRPSQTGNARTAVVCLILGIALVTGSIAVPRLSGGDSHSSNAVATIVMPEDEQVMLERGEHTLHVEYVDVKHRSYEPPVEDEITVTVR